jgi:hypothetical protein
VPHTTPEYPVSSTRRVPSVVRRASASIAAVLLAAGLFAPAASAASAAAPTTKAVPRVVFIVGPAGAATDGYRAQAQAAAAIARRYTPDVVELYSPDATWPAVKQALTGASLVVYMGHGNGWPSRYRDSLYPPSQDGFGLNPESGGGDSSHQYFGEAAVGSEIKLAKNAVVLLNHLCYASGNSEPGLPEGTLDVARQRVDNYAAGFIKAGAAAVIAEAWSSPSYFVRAVLGGGRSIQSAWQSSPSANGHGLAFESTRSPGYVDQMDTETATSGFTRSIVMKAGLAPADVLAGASGSAASAAPGALPAALQPTLAGTGIVLGAPDIIKLPTAGSTVTLDLPFRIKDRKALPKGLQASVRWDPIDVSIVPADPGTEVGAAGAATPATGGVAGGAAAGAGAPSGAAPSGAAAGATPAGPAPTATVTPDTGPAAHGAKPAIPAAPAAGAPTSPLAQGAPWLVKPAGGTTATASGTPAGDPSTGPAATTSGPGVPVSGPTVGDSSGTPVAGTPGTDPAADPATSAEVAAPPAKDLDLVVPEQVGDVVSPAAVKFGKTAMTVPVTLPRAPGRYRLTVTLHDADGVAYDALTQALLPSLMVRVTGDFDGIIQAAPTARLTAGTEATLHLRVENVGATAWGHAAIKTTANVGAGARAEAASLVGRWIPLSTDAVLPIEPEAQTASTALPIALAPGVKTDASLGLQVPNASGQYLLVLDVITPERGSLVASGADPTLVRVTVVAASSN